MSLAADGDALGVREPADEPDGGGGGGHHQRRPLPRQVALARIHREGQGRRLRRRRRAKVSIQGGPSPRGLAYVDSSFKVTSQDGLLIPTRNFKFGVNIF